MTTHLFKRGGIDYRCEVEDGGTASVPTGGLARITRGGWTITVGGEAKSMREWRHGDLDDDRIADFEREVVAFVASWPAR